MAKRSEKSRKRDQESDIDREETIRRSLDEHGGEYDMFNPRTGEDPGLLPMTEDPRERRLKRHTM